MPPGGFFFFGGGGRQCRESPRVSQRGLCCLGSAGFVRRRGGREGGLSPKRGGAVPKERGDRPQKRGELLPKWGGLLPSSAVLGCSSIKPLRVLGWGAPPFTPAAFWRVGRPRAPQKLLPSCAQRGRNRNPKKPPALFKASKLPPPPPAPGDGGGGRKLRGPRNSPHGAAACPGTPVCAAALGFGGTRGGSGGGALC